MPRFPGLTYISYLLYFILFRKVLDARSNNFTIVFDALECVLLSYKARCIEV